MSKRYYGCSENECGDSICINVPVLQVGTGNGSSHKAYIGAQNTGGKFTINGMEKSGTLYCNTEGGSNGTLLVKPTTAHKSGGVLGGVLVKIIPRPARGWALSLLKLKRGKFVMVNRNITLA